MASSAVSLFCALAVNLLVSGETEKGRALADQETLTNSITRLVALLGKAQQYVEEVVVSGTWSQLRHTPCTMPCQHPFAVSASPTMIQLILVNNSMQSHSQAVAESTVRG